MILSVLFQQGKQRKRKHSSIMKSIKDGDFVMEEMDMREEYDIKALNPRKNPYAKKIKKPVTMNYYLDDCVRQQKKLRFVGDSESTSI